MRDHAVTTYEYLLLDNYELGDSHFFVERLTAKPEMNPWDVIGLMAEAFMKRWVEEERLAGVKARMGFEIRMFPYAATRCRKFYAIKPWHLQKNAEIKQYRRMWVSALEDRFARLKVEMS